MISVVRRIGFKLHVPGTKTWLKRSALEAWETLCPPVSYEKQYARYNAGEYQAAMAQPSELYDFKAVTSSLISRLREVVDSSGLRAAELWPYFRRASLYELEFWEATYEGR
jgi:hypothetical protein